MAKLKNLMEHKFEGLKVISRAENSKEGRAQWNVLCKCGKTFITKGKYLLNGDTTSCGCRWETLPKPKNGDKFGELIVQEHLGGQNYSCLCSCGNTKKVIRKQLCNHNTISCGACLAFKSLNKEHGQLKSLSIVPGSLGKLLCVCLTCEKVVVLTASEFIRNESCGCLQYKRPTGVNSPNWKGTTSLNQAIRNSNEYAAWRQLIFERAGFKCETCGDSSGGNLNAHHINHLAKIIKAENLKSIEEAQICRALWNPGNGICLCISCHKLKHKKGL